ncbi:hypothetical protein FBQ82_14075 [Anaerolineae bacterium CFX7]|nr:hypothetical protein [Anaerolineae bacterium CFX7]
MDSDWLELGAGFGMGLTMSAALGNSFINAIDARASMNALTVPQTRAEIQTLLDKLDVRLANGEISETTYRRVSAKWQTRLDNIHP